MSIQKRLMISLGAMIIIPIILFSFILFLLFFVLTGEEGSINSTSSIERLEVRDELFGELKLRTYSYSEPLLDVSYLKEMDERLNNWDYGLVIRMNEDIYFHSESYQDLSKSSVLPEFGAFVNQTHDSIEVNQTSYKLRQHDFYLADGQLGSIFIAEKVSSIEEIATNYWPLIIILLILVLVATNGLLSYFVSKSLISPIQLLQKSSRKIREGQLDFELTSNRKDEIGELIEDFEEMRRKLKESIDLQLQYENNRKILLSNISHDLKTPITSIKGYVEGIREGIANTEEKKSKYLETIYKRANEIDSMIDELFLFSTLDLKQIPFRMQPLNLLSYLKELVEEVSTDLENKNIDIQLTNKESEDLFVFADHEKINRVIQNILQNSTKYMDKPKGKIQIVLEKHQAEAQITIMDNGQGIPQESLPNIFDTFYRADSSRNNKTGGTGLGLAISKQIIEAHQGEISAKSILGEGTKIMIRIPLMN
ncbi:HAMP domain-containing sensor histidine kinase [Bacillaceae bacterium S4-13-56]